MSLIAKELRAHTPFTALGTFSGILTMAVTICRDVPKYISAALFWTMHPAHVLLSAVVTSAIYRLHAEGAFLPTLLLGYSGALVIASLSDCIIPQTWRTTLWKHSKVPLFTEAGTRKVLNGSIRFILPSTG